MTKYILHDALASLYHFYKRGVWNVLLHGENVRGYCPGGMSGEKARGNVRTQPEVVDIHAARQTTPHPCHGCTSILFISLISAEDKNLYRVLQIGLQI